jgi:type I restriction enzyme M protein
MLTPEIKRKIDYLRDALVGKIPVPSDQIAQITLGLIYKFMSDIDEQNEELGGKSFFNGGYKKYSWKNIMDRSLAGHERVLFYSEGLEKMSRNEAIPQLFRDIFRNAFLPFKDPPVLDLFLKGINEFKYEHSEDLGDAFEYLLSTAASQGDAGQFRTPRHIIDFIVEAVDPQKEDRILDPACGTAGFLVAAYKYILKNNTDKRSGKPGSLLTTTERKKLTKNIVGYDISHEMVRLSLVNLYLHGFAEPNIYEYDTLSSLDRWDDNFDCLLANPPFMTPKGGIKPHNRFPIQANRSEVLFVDYITEHLNPNGKAGIIVPEGIIFQSGGAYKQLRKMLVEDGLWAVVSLPQGVFNPYSGVKTSILFFSNPIARQTKEILFVRVENDGFNLGAQRKEIDENDLPKALGIIKRYKKTAQENKKFSLTKTEEKFASVIKKEKITENGDYNLSADRYLVATDYANAKWPMVELGEAVISKSGNNKIIKGTLSTENDGLLFPVYSATGQDVYSDKYDYEGDGIIVSAVGARCGKCFLANGRWRAIANTHILLPKKEKSIASYVWYLVNDEKFWVRGGVAQPFVKINDSLKRKIPLPPIGAQKKIITELDGYQKIIDGAKQIVDNYKPTIKIDPAWKIVELGDIFEKIGIVIDPSKNKGKGNYIGLENIISNSGELTGEIEIEISKLKSAKSVFEKNDILYGKLRPNLNKVWFSDREGICSTDILVLRAKNRDVNPKFYSVMFRGEDFNGKVLGGLKGAQLPRVSFDFISTIKIPFPPLVVQKEIATKIDNEQQYVYSAQKMIKLFEQKIKDKISELWGE